MRNAWGNAKLLKSCPDPDAVFECGLSTRSTCKCWLAIDQDLNACSLAARVGSSTFGDAEPSHLAATAVGLGTVQYQPLDGDTNANGQGPHKVEWMETLSVDRIRRCLLL